MKQRTVEVQNILDYINVRIELEHDLSFLFPEDSVYNDAKILAFREIEKFIKENY